MKIKSEAVNDALKKYTKAAEDYFQARADYRDFKIKDNYYFAIKKDFYQALTELECAIDLEDNYSKPATS